MVLKLEVGKYYYEAGSSKIIKITRKDRDDDKIPFLGSEVKNGGGGGWYREDGSKAGVCEYLAYEVCKARGGEWIAKSTEIEQHKAQEDPINHPSHYTSHPAKCECGRQIECVQIAEHLGFNLGNVLKYIWRKDLKENALKDLKKAKWYLEREISKMENEGNK